MMQPRPKRCKVMRFVRLTFPLVVFLAVAPHFRVAAFTEIIKDEHLEGPNVCKEVENITVTITTPREEAYQERFQKWCVGIPPRCSAYRIKTRTINETRTIIKQRIVKKCCVGYGLSEDENHCVPECKAGCRNGVCVEPDVCQCHQGFAGKSCNTKCPPNRWGSDCSQRCKCANEATCKAADGSCACQRGFKGRYCEETCASDRYGQDCAELCQCANGGKCDHVSGECFCAAGFTGPLCQESCPPGTHGAQCQSKCRCQNGGTCDPVTGECVCPAGYTGTVCANRCQPGFYGIGCTKRCECFNGADCDRVSGQCVCAPGFMGAKCLDSCPDGQYGINCAETCRCQNGAPCDPADGKCTCADGWTGADCGQRVCPIDRFGANCTGICDCAWNNTKMCHPWTGKCQCSPGWSNSACDRPCRFLRYGQDCKLSCNCKNSSPCSHIDGACQCIAGFRGESCEEPCSNNTYGQNCSERCQCMNGATCEGDTGECLCSPGWQGIKCDRPCNAQHYGRDCTEKCRCQNGGVCNPINGQCSCAAGWTGELCENKCDSGRFGQNCDQICDCHYENTIACNATTGRCICRSAWGGIRCESRCALGFYGDTCSEICTCHNNSSCDPTSGDCICSPGWTGPTCTDPCPAGFFGHACKQRCPGSGETNRTCNALTGQYTCPPGYIGSTCEHPCSSGFYGQDCEKRCNCQNSGECSHVTGQCQCSPGWTGTSCQTSCEEMYYGTNCSQRCNCRNNAKCRKNDGNCICEAGWMGQRCDEVCPDGFYGNHCLETCNCPSGNFLCHAAKGCVCRVGFSGKHCEDASRNELLQERVDEGTTTELNSTLQGSETYNISIGLLNASVVHEQDRHHTVVNGKRSEPDPAKRTAPYNVTIVFPLFANSFLPHYNRTHSLRPGQQVTLLYRPDGFLDLAMVQMHSYVTMADATSGSTNFMETFVNSTSYRVHPVNGSESESVVPVTVAYVNLQESAGNGSGNRSFELRSGQKIVIRLVRLRPGRNGTNNRNESSPEHNGTTEPTGQTTPEYTETLAEIETNFDEFAESTEVLSTAGTSFVEESSTYFSSDALDLSNTTEKQDVPGSLSDMEEGIPTGNGEPNVSSPEQDNHGQDLAHNDEYSTFFETTSGVPTGNDQGELSNRDPVNPREEEEVENRPDNGTERNMVFTAKRIGLSAEGLPGASGSGTVWAIVLTILFGSIVAAILIYYRRRVANLKAEVNHVVNYMTQEQPSHFDNPVYARTGNGGTANGTANGSIANGGTVPPLDARMGLLRSVLPINLRKPSHDKYSYPDNEYGMDKSYSISHYGPESLKNFEADMTNPNCFKDHVYDEIRLKDSIDTEYDHLDYSRPGSSHKAHYFRMNDETPNGTVVRPGGLSLHGGNHYQYNGGAGPSTVAPGGLDGSPKAINVLREPNGMINNLSAPPPRVNLQVSLPTADGSLATPHTPDTANVGNDLSSSSNSSLTPPSHSPSASSTSQDQHNLATHRLIAPSSRTPPNETVDDGEVQQLYMPMRSNAEPAGPSSSIDDGSEFAGTKIPDHQLNIKE